MTDEVKESALTKLYKARQEKAKSYKTAHDVTRALALAHLGHLLRDYPAASALAASVSRELTSLNAKQEELDAAEKAAAEKEYNEAKAADDKAAAEQNAPKKEEPEESPTHPTVAPSVTRR